MKCAREIITLNMTNRMSSLQTHVCLLLNALCIMVKFWPDLRKESKTFLGIRVFSYSGKQEGFQDGCQVNFYNLGLWIVFKMKY